MQVCGLPIHQSWPVAELHSCNPASRDAPMLLRLLQADGTGSGCRCVVLLRDQIGHTPSTHVSKPGRNPFLENGCARGSAPETDWRSRAVAGIPSRMNAHCMLPEFGQAVGRVEPGSKQQRASVGDCTPQPQRLGWPGLGIQRATAGHSRPGRARPLGGGLLLDRCPGTHPIHVHTISPRSGGTLLAT